jgi:iron complex outermembrane receptor protein
MANHSPFLKATRVRAAVALCIASCASAWAQQNPTEITITDKLPARVSGFGDMPAHELPFNTTTIDSATLKDIGAQRVSDALRLDASVTDSYNSPAYWDMLSVRGYTLNNRYNYQREGLPISAETMISMDDKERIELLKGTSGMQAGTSAPGGLVNYVVKRAPTNAEQKIRNITLSYGQGNNRSVAADLGGRFGENADFGYRFNVAHEDLDPYIKNTKGHRDLVALAMDWRINGNSKLEWEFEQSHREQIGVNGYSLLGGQLPPTVDGTKNFTYQAGSQTGVPKSQPGVFDAFTGSVRFKHNLDNGWLWTTQYGTQRLKTDDRLSFAFGADNYGIATNFKSNGDFDLYDWRSENERRLNEAVQTELSGSTVIGQQKHDLKISFMRQRQLDRMPLTQTNNYVGSANIYSNQVDTTYAYTDSPPSTNRTEYSNEFALKDRVHLTQQTSAWLGLRQIQMNRQSVRTDGSRPVQDARNVTTPWVAFSHALDQSVTVYASYGQGIETEVTPNKTGTYANAGQALPVLRSYQREVGVKGQTTASNWQVTWFDITRPTAGDAPASGSLVNRQMDGEARHRGLELSGSTSVQNWKLGSGFTWINAKRQNAVIDTSVNGERPLNVPAYILRGMAEYRYSSVPGLRTGLRLSHEGKRGVTEQSNGDIQLPAWTTLDASAHYDTKVNNVASTWTLAIDNLADKRYWRESPKQFGHYYLYPGAPRTLRASVQFRL